MGNFYINQFLDINFERNVALDELGNNVFLSFDAVHNEWKLQELNNIQKIFRKIIGFLFGEWSPYSNTHLTHVIPHLALRLRELPQENRQPLTDKIKTLWEKNSCHAPFTEAHPNFEQPNRSILQRQPLPINNYNNHCGLNSLLQALFSEPHFVEELSSTPVEGQVAITASLKRIYNYHHDRSWCWDLGREVARIKTHINQEQPDWDLLPLLNNLPNQPTAISRFTLTRDENGQWPETKAFQELLNQQDVDVLEPFFGLNPAYIPIHINRNNYVPPSHANGQRGYQEKIETKIEFNLDQPYQIFDSPYKISSVVCHTGNPLGGHYYTITQRGSRWYLCDDQRISQLTPAQAKVHMEKAYMAFLSKVDPN